MGEPAVVSEAKSRPSNHTRDDVQVGRFGGERERERG